MIRTQCKDKCYDSKNLEAILKRKLLSKAKSLPSQLWQSEAFSSQETHVRAKVHQAAQQADRKLLEVQTDQSSLQVYSFAFASSEHFGMICAGMLGSHAAEFGKMPTDGFVPQSKFFSIFG